ncbi:methyl-accepting chemotaxis protein [Halothiobacillus neapolitanus]|uniref:methyl-accepting chemotaxis protein n=1 Tax=Halothiobacillus neapolitanus TaxID=927 RepID=UPI00105B8340|nr:methyl-accepting chemotaxis protein [Halothiobacillus neapolitanus]
MRRLKWSFIAMGFGMGAIFPVFASFFVNFREGMLSWFVLGCVVAGITVGFVNYWVAQVVLLRQLSKMAILAGLVRQGDLTSKCALKSDDAIGEISDSFNGMIDTLHRQIGDINHGSASMQEAANSLDRRIGQVMTEQNRVQSQRDRVLVEVSRLAESGSELRSALQRVGQQAVAMQSRSEQSQGQISRSVDSIHSALARVDTATRHIHSLVSAKEEIESMTRTISSVADQTNLLALNAAIEAARAGEHGRGFAVVAEEVRALALRSQDATVQISAVMERLTREVSQTDQTMTEVVDYSQQAEAAMSAAQGELEQVLVAIDDSVSATLSVESNSQEHQETIEQLNADLHALIDVITANAEHMTAAQIAVSSVQQDAQKLGSMVSGFRI